MVVPTAGSETWTWSPACASCVSVGSEEEWVSDRIPVESVIFALQSSSLGVGRTDWRAQTHCPHLLNQHAKDLFFVQYVLAANLVKMPPIKQSIRRANPY